MRRSDRSHGGLRLLGGQCHSGTTWPGSLPPGTMVTASLVRLAWFSQPLRRRGGPSLLGFPEAAEPKRLHPAMALGGSRPGLEDQLPPAPWFLTTALIPSDF